MDLSTESYLKQRERLMNVGKQIVAQYDEETIVLYIPGFGEFYGTTTVSRPIIIQPNFTRVMQESDWLMRPDQQALEVVRLLRSEFDKMLHDAVHARFQPDLYASEEAWQAQRDTAKVMIDWDRVDSPEDGERFFFQMGIHSRYWIDQMLQGNIKVVEDVEAFIAEQRPNAQAPFSNLVVPQEDIYPIADADVAARLGFDG